MRGQFARALHREGVSAGGVGIDLRRRFQQKPRCDLDTCKVDHNPSVVFPDARLHREKVRDQLTGEQRLEQSDNGHSRQLVAVVLMFLMWFAVPAIAFGIAAMIYKFSDSIGYALLISYGWVVVSVAVLMRVFNRRARSQSDWICPRDGEKQPFAGEKAFVAIAFLGFLVTLIAMGASDKY